MGTREPEQTGSGSAAGASDHFQRRALRPQDQDECGPSAARSPRGRAQDRPASSLHSVRPAPRRGDGQAVLTEEMAADQVRQRGQIRVGRQAEHQGLALSRRHGDTPRRIIECRGLQDVREWAAEDRVAPPRNVSILMAWNLCSLGIAAKGVNVPTAGVVRPCLAPAARDT